MALDALLPRLHHSDWSVRRKAVQAIGTVAEAACGTTRAVELLHSAARDPDEDVVLAVLAALPGAAPRKCKQARAYRTGRVRAHLGTQGLGRAWG